MRLSKLFTKTRKERVKGESSINAQLLLKGAFVDKEMAGVYTFLPLGLRVLRKIERIIREEIEAIGGQEILMPALTSIKKYKQTKRDKLDVLFKTKLYSGSEYVLNQSHEEVITPLVQQFARSYKDLPVYVYQIQTKFRNEPRAKSGLLRGREFLMKDLYSFHCDENDLENYYETVKKAYFKIFKRLGFGEKTLLTFASGGTFSKYSHEFQTLSETGEDEIYVCVKCKTAVNKEIINKQKVCPQCNGKKLRPQRAIEVGNIFKLKEKFSKAFNYTYIDNKGVHQPVVMGCYGIGLSRAMATAVELNHDEKGIIWPEEIAPYKVHLIDLTNKNRKDSQRIYNQLVKRGIEVLYDDREEVSAGEKLVDADLIGCPYRLVISKRTLDQKSVELKKRKQRKSQLLRIKDIEKNKAIIE